MLAEPTFNPREARERTLEVCHAAAVQVLHPAFRPETALAPTLTAS